MISGTYTNTSLMIWTCNHRQLRHHWFRQWFVAYPATNHYLNWWWHIYWTLGNQWKLIFSQDINVYFDIVHFSFNPQNVGHFVRPKSRTDGFHSQRASNAESVSMSWRLVRAVNPAFFLPKQEWNPMCTFEPALTHFPLDKVAAISQAIFSNTEKVTEKVRMLVLRATT